MQFPHSCLRLGGGILRTAGGSAYTGPDGPGHWIIVASVGQCASHGQYRQGRISTEPMLSGNQTVIWPGPR